MPNYVFGPVPSRRLGRSLGVDIIPLKTCAFNCIYCQLGRTADPNITLGEFAPVAEVLAQVHDKLAAGAAPDFITISGSGEPTLHRRLGEIIRGVKAMTSAPVAVLTHGALFSRAEARRNCHDADVILPSLDAGDEITFRRINRPHPALTLAVVARGLEALRAEYSGQIWLEVFLVAGINADEEHCRGIKRLADRIRPDRIHLNTAVRPTTEPGILPVPPERMAELCRIFGDNAEVIADYAREPIKSDGRVTAEAVFEMLGRRPCTIEDVASGLGSTPSLAARALDTLAELGKITKSEQQGRVYYKLR